MDRYYSHRHEGGVSFKSLPPEIWDIGDREKPDNIYGRHRVAVCYSEENAALVVRALNALEAAAASSTASRSPAASRAASRDDAG